MDSLSRRLRPALVMLVLASGLLGLWSGQAGAESASSEVRAFQGGTLDGGDLHTCAVLQSGNVRCWGFGGNGELGYANTDTIGDTETPGSVGPVNARRGPHRPRNHRRPAPHVRAARRRQRPLLGLRRQRRARLRQHRPRSATTRPPARSDRSTSAQAAPPARSPPATSTRARCSTTATSAAGAPAPAASSATPTPPRSATTRPPARVGPVNLGAGRTARAITAGGCHTCALLDDGNVRCWGDGDQRPARLRQHHRRSATTETPGIVGPVDLGAGRTARAITAGDAPHLRAARRRQRPLLGQRRRRPARLRQHRPRSATHETPGIGRARQPRRGPHRPRDHRRRRPHVRAARRRQRPLLGPRRQRPARLRQHRQRSATHETPGIGRPRQPRRRPHRPRHHRRRPSTRARCSTTATSAAGATAPTASSATPTPTTIGDTETPGSVGPVALGGPLPAKVADLSLGMTASETSRQVGEQVTFTLTVTNSGPDTLQAHSIAVALPGGLTALSATPSQGYWNATAGRWNPLTLASGASRDARDRRPGQRRRRPPRRRRRRNLRAARPRLDPARRVPQPRRPRLRHRHRRRRRRTNRPHRPRGHRRPAPTAPTERRHRRHRRHRGDRGDDRTRGPRGLPASRPCSAKRATRPAASASSASATASAAPPESRSRSATGSKTIQRARRQATAGPNTFTITPKKAGRSPCGSPPPAARPPATPQSSASADVATRAGWLHRRASADMSCGRSALRGAGPRARSRRSARWRVAPIVIAGLRQPDYDRRRRRHPGRSARSTSAAGRTGRGDHRPASGTRARCLTTATSAAGATAATASSATATPTAIGDNETPGSVGPVNLGAGRTARAITAGAVPHVRAARRRQRPLLGLRRRRPARLRQHHARSATTRRRAASAPSTSAPAAPPARSPPAGSHTCALLDDGNVRCWGCGSNGQLGYGNIDQHRRHPDETPGTVGPVDLGAGRTARAITAGDIPHVRAARRRQGPLLGLRRRRPARLRQHQHDRRRPDETPGTVGPVNLGAGRTARAITAGDDHTCALLDDGNVRCWGLGSEGALGYGNVNNIGDDTGETPGSCRTRQPRRRPHRPRDHRRRQPHVRAARRRQRPLLGPRQQRPARVRQHHHDRRHRDPRQRRAGRPWRAAAGEGGRPLAGDDGKRDEPPGRRTGHVHADGHQQRPRRAPGALDRGRAAGWADRAQRNAQPGLLERHRRTLEPT